MSRITDSKLPACASTGDCWKQIIEKTGYHGIWPIPGSGESLVQKPAGGLESWKFFPSGIYPWRGTPGEDPFNAPVIDRTTPICASTTPTCCNTCQTYQDTDHRHQGPDPTICACIIKDDNYRDPDENKTTDIQCAGIASSTSEWSDSTPATTYIREEWTYDTNVSTGADKNWVTHNYNRFDTSGTPQWDIPRAFEKSMTFNAADQPTSETIKERYYVPGTGTGTGWQTPSSSTTFTIKYDKRGNLWSDGRKVFEYDVLNRLTGVWEKDTTAPSNPIAKGKPIAAFTYDGYGHRLTARYNSGTNNSTLDDDPVDIYSYDHLWRIRTVTEAHYHSSTSTWTSFIREQWFYHTSDSPHEYKVGSDAPVMRRIDTDGDGDFDKSQHFVTDRQGSVVAVLDDASPVDPDDQSYGGKPGDVLAYVTYDSYGTPLLHDPADINRDGVVDSDDVAAYIVYWQKWYARTSTSDRYKQICDFNNDGTVDTDGDATGPFSTNDDFSALCTRVTAQLVQPTEWNKVLGNLPLYCGYWWDLDLGMYHVRNRVYRPQWGKWIQRDPLGYAAGWNLYEYVGGEPWWKLDPLGLADKDGTDRGFLQVYWDNLNWNALGDWYHDRRVTYGYPGTPPPSNPNNANNYANDFLDWMDGRSGSATPVSYTFKDPNSGSKFKVVVAGLGAAGVITLFVVDLATTGPEDAVFMAIFKGVSKLVKIGGKWIAKLADGTERALTEAEAEAVEAAMKNGAKEESTACNAAKGAAGNAKGASRAERVAEMTGGTVSGKKIKTKYGGTDVDVVGPNGEYIEVGGPSKSINKSRFGQQLKVLTEAAKEAGVPAKVYLEEGTAQDIIDLAKQWVGDQNVVIFTP